MPAIPAPDTARQASHAIVNLSGYRFVPLTHLPLWQHDMLQAFEAIGVKGTILLADEGINVAVAGSVDQTLAVRRWFDRFEPLRDLWLKETRSATCPFGKLKIRIRPDIIPFGNTAEAPAAVRPAAGPDHHAPKRPTAPALSPEDLERWLDAGHDDQQRPFVLLDTRNDYEVESGTFTAAQHLSLKTFRDFTARVEQALDDGSLDTRTPVVTFCTGGIRCEKAAPWLRQRGFDTVLQVDGGILNYFDRCNDTHWSGHCFVFDDRVEIDSAGEPTGAALCAGCHRAVDDPSTCPRCSRRAIDTV